MKTGVTTIRASRATQVIFSVIALIVALPGIDALRLGQWQGFAFLVVGLGMIGSIQRYRIAWDDETLSYRGILRSGKMRFSEITRFEIGGPSRGKPQEPTVGLRLFSARSSGPVMIINIKPFSREGVARLVERLPRGVSERDSGPVD